MNCPKCEEECYRDEVDVEVGVIHGPYGCVCGWSEDSYYDCSDGPSLAEKSRPGYYIDSCGRMYSHDRIEENLDRLGLNGDKIINEIFKS